MHLFSRIYKSFFSVLCFFSFAFISQAAVPGDSISSADRILAGTFANDATFRTDYYFTQGMSVNLVHPALGKSSVNKLLLGSKRGGLNYYGFKIRYDGFTPLQISDPEIRYGDRPYAAYIYATQYRIKQDAAKKQRLTSGLDLGFIGPKAGAGKFQTKVHEWLDAPAPQGWKYQVNTNLVLGYQALYEKELLHVAKVAELVGVAEGSLSTLYTYAQSGFLLRSGKMNGYFQNLGITSRQNRVDLQKFQFYAQGRFTGRLVGYNATLQGGVLHQNNSYTLKAKEIKRTVSQRSAGLVGAYKGISFESSVVWLTPEFKNGRSHKWMFFELRFII